MSYSAVPSSELEAFESEDADWQSEYANLLIPADKKEEEDTTGSMLALLCSICSLFGALFLVSLVLLVIPDWSFLFYDRRLLHMSASLPLPHYLSTCVPPCMSLVRIINCCYIELGK